MKIKNKWTRTSVSLLLLAAILLSLFGCAAPSESLQASEPTISATDVVWPDQSIQEGTSPSGTESIPDQEDGGAGSVDQPDDRDDPLHTRPADQTQPGTEGTEAAQEDTKESKPTEPAENPTEPTVKPTEPSKPVVTGSGLKVHFIDVGQADAALVTCDNKTMLIDGGNAADSNLMYAYLKRNGITHLDYVIGTHAHEDHIGGLAGALNYATVGKVYCPTTSYDSKAFTNFAKAVSNRGALITVPYSGMSFSLGGATVKILAVNAAAGTNNTSIVLRITYGATSFLFTGDAELEVEQMLINSGVNLQSTVLKVGHHGSSTSSSYGFLWHVMPKYAVISVGKGNSYGHPTENVLSRLRDAGSKLFRTDIQGDIIATSNGSSVSFSVSRNANADTFGGIGGNSTQTQPTQPPETTQPPQPTQPPQTEPTQPTTTAPAEDTQPPATEDSAVDYIINKNSGLFHEPDCGAVENMNPKNKLEYSGTKEELIEQGYTPCGWCKP